MLFWGNFPGLMTLQGQCSSHTMYNLYTFDPLVLFGALASDDNWSMYMLRYQLARKFSLLVTAQAHELVPWYLQHRYCFSEDVEKSGLSAIFTSRVSVEAFLEHFLFLEVTPDHYQVNQHCHVMKRGAGGRGSRTFSSPSSSLASPCGCASLCAASHRKRTSWRRVFWRGTSLYVWELEGRGWWCQSWSPHCSLHSQPSHSFTIGSYNEGRTVRV